MATEVYLGYPPPNVRAWIENKYKTTIITFDNGDKSEYEWSGYVTRQTLIDAGIYDGENYEWFKNPVQIQFGTTVTTITDNAFTDCTSLTSVSMPNVTTVGGYAFNQCTNLTSVSMPNVTTVEGDAFYNCTSLTTVSMPNVTTVGTNAFYNCTNLTSVSMPNVTTVGGYAFCFISTSVEFENQTTSKISGWFESYVFGDYWGPVTVTCSDGSVHAEFDYSEYTWTITITPAQQ